MPIITTNDIRSIIYQNNQLFIPDAIESAIMSTFKEKELIESVGIKLLTAYREMDKPIRFDYSENGVPDAYALFYTRRNTLVPRIAFRDLLLNPHFHQLPPEIRVLDLGSGTGAVILGLLDMFAHAPLNKIAVHIHAVDISRPMLDKLEELVRSTQFNPKSLKTTVLDLRDITQLQSVLRSSGKFDFIFAANIFAELDQTEAVNVLTSVAPYLNNDGAIVIVDAQRNHGKFMLPVLIPAAHNVGLNVYYPCPPSKSHSCGQCWFWREDAYSYNPIIIEGRPIGERYREQLVAHWLILTKNGCSIYDDFMQGQNLDWGPISFFGEDSINNDSQVCTPKEIKNHLRVGKECKRGSIVGGSGNPFKITQYFEL
jgi:SAM-dependent methyltransferase